MSGQTKKNRLDKFHYHEVVDRIETVRDLFDRQISDHPAAKRHLSKECAAVELALSELSSKAGGLKAGRK